MNYPDNIDFPRFVPPEGPEDADIMMIGEAPGRKEVEEERPFVGQSGQLLRNTAREVGIDIFDVYITNTVKERPPNNRDPDDEEIEKWKVFLDEEIATVDPEVILTLGGTAMKRLSIPGRVTRARGEVYHYKKWKVIPTVHPAYVLRKRSVLPDLKSDLELCMTNC